MLVYKHTQVGYVTAGALAAGALTAYLGIRAEDEGRGWVGSALVAGLAVGAVLFASLTVQVDTRELRFYFGPGFWERRIPLDAIRRIEVVRNPVYYGWGVRYMFPGWLYNVSGLKAVELDVRGEGTIRIGTDEPEQLRQALVQARQEA